MLCLPKLLKFAMTKTIKTLLSYGMDEKELSKSQLTTWFRLNDDMNFLKRLFDWEWLFKIQRKLTSCIFWNKKPSPEIFQHFYAPINEVPWHSPKKIHSIILEMRQKMSSHYFCPLLFDEKFLLFNLRYFGQKSRKHKRPDAAVSKKALGLFSTQQQQKIVNQGTKKTRQTKRSETISFHIPHIF